MIAGCATVVPPPRQQLGADERRLIALLRDEWEHVTGLRTLADVTVQRGTQRQQVQGVVLAARPASVRFEALSPMGPPLMIATIRDGQLTAYDATTNEAHVGAATPEVTAHVLGLPFEPEDLVAALLGLALPPADVRVAEMVPPDALGPSIELIGPVNRRRIWMDTTTGLVHQVDLTGGRAEARIRFVRDPDGTLRGFDMTAAMSYISASVRYKNPVFNAEIDPTLFAFAIPKSAKIQDIR